MKRIKCPNCEALTSENYIEYIGDGNYECLNCKGQEWNNKELRQEYLIDKLKLSPKKLVYLNEILEIERDLTLE